MPDAANAGSHAGGTPGPKAERVMEIGIESSAMSGPSSPLRVCLDARLVSGGRGGVEQVIIGLANAMSGLDDGDEQYLFPVERGHTAWLEPYISGRCSPLEPGGVA